MNKSRNYLYRTRTKREDLESLTKMSLEGFFAKLYFREEHPMSCAEIKEKVQSDYNISYSRQYIWHIINRIKRTRSNAESMKVRAITGRMDYTKSTNNIDYKNRKINYEEIAKRGSVNSKKCLIIELDKEALSFVKQLARSKKETISDILKMLFPRGNEYKTLVAREKEKYRELRMQRAVYQMVFKVGTLEHIQKIMGWHSDAEMARALRISRAYMCNLRKEKCKVTPTIMTRIAAQLGIVDGEWWKFYKLKRLKRAYKNKS